MLWRWFSGSLPNALRIAKTLLLAASTAIAEIGCAQEAEQNASPGHMVFELKKGQSANYDGKLAVTLTDVVFEEIAADGTGNYPSGNGVNAYFSARLGQENHVFMLNQLSAPYEGIRKTDWSGYRFELIEARESANPTIKLQIERSPAQK